MNVCCADDSELGIQDSIVNASNIFSFASVFLIISTVLLSVIMIIQSTANALSLRKSDIGLLKAIGYKNSQIFACLYCEQLRVTFTRFAVGTIISIIVTAVSNFSLQTEISSTVCTLSIGELSEFCLQFRF